MEIKNVAIYGTGAVGSYLLWGLSNKPEIDLSVIASGERKARYEKDGFVINGKTYHPTIRTPKEAGEHGTDFVIVCVKYNALPSVLEEIKETVGENTTVMSLMNGVDSEERIGEVIGEDKVLYSLIKIASERIGNEVRFDAETTIGIIMGEKDKSASSERTDAICELFKDSGIHYRVSDEILSEIWSKFRLNVSMNQPQAMINCGVGAYTDSEHAKYISDMLKEEVNRIAEAKGIDISLSAKGTAAGTPVKPRARYSTLQDLDAKRHTEVDMFAGTVVRMGREIGIPTPYNDFTYHMIKALEEKNDGLFDYE
ncbi:MAG: ketopantoate reductase family protein [Clostridia bacterium]|nr:ketopantoate reductase family protein [Clostridia bacterium]